MALNTGFRTIDKLTGKVLSTWNGHSKLIGETATQNEKISLYKSTQGYYFLHTATATGETAHWVSESEANGWIQENLQKEPITKAVLKPENQYLSDSKDSKWALAMPEQPEQPTQINRPDYKTTIKNLRADGVTLEEIIRAFLD